MSPTVTARRARSLAIAGMLAMAAGAQGIELTGFLAAEGRVFPRPALHPGQGSASASFVAKPELYQEWNDGRDSVLFVPFVRLDSLDSERTHADIRELQYQHVGSGWEARLGIGRVFWGVTESQHLVDIINQTDLVENIDGEDKLGQPMINLSLLRDWGTVDLFVLPGFRERTFPGRSGRLRTAIPVDTDRPSYESNAGNLHVDYAVRWSQAADVWDVGVYHFYGTSRDPLLVPLLEPRNEPRLIPRYDLIHQTGVDAQATVGELLLKLEAIRQDRGGEVFHALTGGFEYTFVGAFGTRADLGLLAEYLYDSRDDQAPVAFEDDFFFGLRVTANDVQSTRVLAGVIVDRESGARLWSLEASTRLGDRWRLELEARAFGDVEPEDPQYAVRNDDYVQLTIARFF